MLGLIYSLVCIGFIGYVFGKSPTHNNTQVSDARQGRFFPFYTIGRFANDVCTGSNSMFGTCVIRGECSDGGGIATGSCNSITSQAVCCVYQFTCGATSAFNNTYFYNSGFPGSFGGGERCSMTIQPCSADMCQIRIDFLSLSLAPPSGDGVCETDFLSITGSSSRIPNICGENTGQHIYANFNGLNNIVISVSTTPDVTFNRNWQLQISQLSCNASIQAPSGCLQYYLEESGNVQSFNYGSSPNALTNSVGMEGSRQLANIAYGVCIRMAANRCSITWSQVGSDLFSFTLTGDVGAVDPTLLGTVDVQQQSCTTDYIIVPSPEQNGAALPSDRFCGLGLIPTTSNIKPFVLYVQTDGDETLDISNRGFALSYSQNSCPIQ